LNVTSYGEPQGKLITIKKKRLNGNDGGSAATIGGEGKAHSKRVKEERRRFRKKK